MRIVAQNEFFDSYQLPPSRIQWAARNAAEAATDVGAPSLIVEALEELYEMTRGYAARRHLWKAARNEGADPAIAARDHALDRSFSNFVTRVEMELEDWGPDSPRGQAAQAMLDGAIDVEVRSVTNAPREDEEAMLRAIITKLENDHTAHIATCGLEDSFDLLNKNFSAFVDVISVASETDAPPTTEELHKLERTIRQKMIEAIHRVNGAYPTPSADDREMRSKLLGPFAIQNDRAAAYYRRTRAGGPLPDIDPETGDELVDETTDADRAGE